MNHTETRNAPPLTRRTVLKGALAASAAGVSTAGFGGQALAQDERSFVIEQGDECFVVTALSTGETVEEFYGYGDPHLKSADTTTGIERSDVSNLFLFDGPNGLSLVVLHDEQGDGSGGAATFDFTGLPVTEGQWVVQDDVGDFNSATDTSPDWGWANPATDGGAWRGGLDGAFSLTVDPAFNEDAVRPGLDPGTIDEWHALSGDASDPERILLDMEEPVTIHTDIGVCPIEVEIDIKPGSERNPIDPDGKDKIPVAVLHTSEFDPARIAVDTIRFGPPDVVDAGGGAEEAHSKLHREDVDKDGDEDVMLHFPTQETGFDAEDEMGKLVGETTDGVSIVGTDTITIVGRKTGSRARF